MDYIFLLGRFIYGLYFLYNGIDHILKNGVLSAYAANKGVPLPRLAVYISGFMILFGGLGVIVGSFFLFWSLVLIAVFLIVVTLMVHNFWKISDPNLRNSERAEFLKNLGLLGATLMLLAIVYEAQALAVPLSLPLY